MDKSVLDVIYGRASQVGNVITLDAEERNP